MGNDIFNHQRTYMAWKQNFVDDKGNVNFKYLEEGLTKENSKLFIQYILDLEQGVNIPKTARKGSRSPKTLNRLRSKILRIMKGFQDMGIQDVSKVNYKQVNFFFKKWRDEGHTADYAVRFNAFWNWWKTKNRREGKLVPDICEDLDTTKTSDSKFVWLNKEEFDKYRKYFDEEKQLLLMFVWDSIVRSPSEVSGLVCGDVYSKPNGEVWINVRDEISKTFGRQFNLVYCGEQVLKYIEGKEDNEPLFQYSSPMFNKEMQKVAKQLWKDKKNIAGEHYKNITLYDLRHSGAINFRQLFQNTGQSLDSLRHRGGWTDFKMINYYTKLLGLDGHIDKEKTLLQEDKTNMEKEIEKLKEQRNKDKYEFSKQLKEIYLKLK